MLLLGTGAAWAQSAPPPHAPRQPPARAQHEQREPRREQQAEPQRDQREQRGSDQGLPESVRRVERQTGGEVLRAEPMQRDGREVYRLKVLTADGRVRVVQDDPERPRGERPADTKGKGKQKDDTSRDSDETPPQ